MGHGATPQTVLEALAPQCHSTVRVVGSGSTRRLLAVPRARPRMLDLTTIKQPEGSAKVPLSQAGTRGDPMSRCARIKQPEGRVTQPPGALGLRRSLKGKAQIPRVNLRKKRRFPDLELQGGGSQTSPGCAEFGTGLLYAGVGEPVPELLSPMGGIGCRSERLFPLAGDSWQAKQPDR